MGRRGGLALAVLAAAVLAVTDAPPTGADGSSLTVTIKPFASTVVVSSSPTCVGVHVADPGGSPVVNASAIIEFSKTPRGSRLPDYTIPPTDANGDTTICFLLPDIGEYDLYVNQVVTAAGWVSATSNTAVINITVPPVGSFQGLEATASVAPAQLIVGDEYTLQVTVRSDFGEVAVGYQLDVAAPPGSLVDATPSRGSCSGALVCDFGPIAPNDSVYVDVRLRATTVGSTTIPIGWIYTGPSGAFVPTNGTSATAIVAPRIADLALTVLPSRTAALLNHRVNATISVVNNGPNIVGDATLTLAGPTGWLRVNPASASGCTPTPTTCQLHELQSGASQQIAVIITPQRLGRAALVAAVSSATATDEQPVNNTRTLVITITKPSAHRRP